MTERLRVLLIDQADDVAVPAPDAAAIIREGRRLRRRRPVGTGLAAAAAVVLSVGGTALLTDQATNRPVVTQTFSAADPGAALQEWGAFSVGSTVYLGNHKVELDQQIKSMYYTSEGVLVRMGKVAELDSGEPSKYVLISPDGATRGIPLHMGDRVPGTDPASPYVTYADPAEKGPLVERCFEGVVSLKTMKQERTCSKAHEPRKYDLVAVDLRTGEEAHRATYDGKFTWGGWEAPPVSTYGNKMWALFDAGWVEYDWAAGSTRLLSGTKGFPLEAAGGVYAGPDRREFKARRGEDPMEGEPVEMDLYSFTTGSRIAHPMVTSGGALSPDGRVVMDRDMSIEEGVSCIGEVGSPQQTCTTPTSDPRDLPENQGLHTRLHTLATGKVVSIDDVWWGWTPEGDVISVDADTDKLTRCDSATGACRDLSLEIPQGKVKVGGLSYES